MQVVVEPIITGWLTIPKELFLKDTPGKIRVPVPCYLIRHPKGLVLLDSGMHPQMADDPASRLGPNIPFEYSIDSVCDVSIQLRERGLEPADILYLINSHLHFDHAGGNALIPKATVIVQERDWAVAKDPAQRKVLGYFPHDYETGQKVQVVDGYFDLFNDGAIECFPTNGHTPGHQSLKAATKAGDVILAVDACDLRENLEDLHLPGMVWNEEQALASLKLLRQLRQQGATIVAGHDERDLKDY